jgi:hypothetical protein
VYQFRDWCTSKVLVLASALRTGVSWYGFSFSNSENKISRTGEATDRFAEFRKIIGRKRRFFLVAGLVDFLVLRIHG